MGGSVFAACGLAVGFLFSGTNRALTQRPQMFQREDAGIVAVAPDDLVGIAAHARHGDGRERNEFAWFEEAKGVGRLLALVAAAGARTVGSQVLPVVHAMMTVVPLDD